MKVKALIVDDEPLARKLLGDFAGKVPFLEVVGVFSNGLEALEQLKSTQIDLLFLDIQMPDINGMELLKTLNKPPMVIFTTAFAEYAVEGFELNAVDYLLKPFDFPRFLKAVNKAATHMGSFERSVEGKVEEEENFLFVKDGRKLVKVYHSDILYIQGQKDYALFKMSKGQLLSLITLRELEQQLPSSRFLRIHQSYIVNTRHIDTLTSDGVHIGGTYLNVSQSYKQAFRQFLNRYR